jgi:hypothetical protein
MAAVAMSRSVSLRIVTNLNDWSHTSVQDHHLAAWGRI